MNLGLLLLFIVVQMIVNNVLSTFIPTDSYYGLIAFYLLSCLIISFVGALFSTPRGYRKDFYRHPAFHKTMLTYFIIFFIFDAITLLITYFV